MGTHKPWFIGIAKVILTNLALLLIHYFFVSAVFVFYPLTAFFSVIYLQIFKHLWHRFPMHRRFKNSFLKSVHRSHASHHMNFKFDYFQSRDPKKLADIVSDIHIFPILLSFHYLVLLILVPATHLPTIILSFSLWFGLFEATHWFTHVKDNAVDRVLRKIRGLGYLWAHMVEYHRHHHDHPDKDFNFLFPYLGDRLFGTYTPPEIFWDRQKKLYRTL